MCDFMIDNVLDDLERCHYYFPVEFQVFGSSNDLLSALHRGDVDIATTVALAPVAQLTSRSLKENEQSTLRFFSYSKTTKENPFDAIFVKDNNNINNIGDILNKK